MEINEMKVSDLDSIADNLQTDYDDFWNYNILKKEIENENSILIEAKDEQQDILGFAGIQIILDEVDITNIVTKKNERNKGVGTLLLNKIIEISTQKYLRKINLEVNENNEYAIKLYKKFKFQEIGRRKKYYNGTETAIIMARNIN